MADLTTLDHARAYVARGWSVIPLVPGTKRPAVELRPFLTGEVRLSETDAVSWWEWRPTPYGIGIICGRPSGGLVVVDVDPRNGGDMEATASEVRTDYAVSTPSGGLHLYTCALGPVAKGKTGRPGVDRQGDGGYVVAPPTVLEHGVYNVIRDGDLGDFNLAPAWVRERPAPGAIPDSGALWVAETLAGPASVEPGTQEETLTRLAWWAAGSLDRDIAEAVLWRFAQGLTLGNPSDPWTIAHVRQKLDSAFAKREPVVVVQGSGSQSTGRPQSTPPHGGDGLVYWPADVLKSLCNLEFPEQKWVVEDFVAPGAFTEVIGKVKKGKSTLVYQLIRAVVQGSDFLGRACAASPVVLLTEQAGSSLKATLERAGLVGPLPVVVVQKAGLAALGTWPEAIARVVDLAEWLGSRLIVVDTLSRLARLAGDAENKAGSVAILEPFERARSLGIACVFVRHARKGVSGEVDDIADAARGSSAITGDMDVVIRLRPHRTEDVRVLSWESRLTDDPDDLALRYIDGRYEVVDMPDSEARVEHDGRVGAMRAALAGGARTYPELLRALGWGSRSTIAKYKKIVEDGEPLPAPPDPTNGRVKL